MVYTNVGWVSQFYDTHYVWFSQTDLQKGLILPQKNLIFLHWAKVSTFQKIKLIGSHNGGSQNFENNRLSFVGSHRLGIILFFN